jgi:RHS repeat-associated protein
VKQGTRVAAVLALLLGFSAASLWAAVLVTAATPASGPPLTQVTISGSGFGTHAGSVTFNGAPGQIVSWAATKIVVKAPDGLAGSGPIKVNGQGSGFNFSFTPTIVALVPSKVKTGWTFAVVGENFGSSPGTLTLNGATLTPSLWSNFLILAVVPSAGKTGPVVVTTSVGASNAVTLTVQTTTLPLTVSATATPPANANGWNNTNVTVTFTCNGGTAPVQCPATQTVTTEKANQVISGTAKDASGKTATASVTVNIDKTSPTIVASVSPAPNANNWNKTSPVTVTFTCSDALSGVVACPAAQTVTTPGAAQLISGTVSDKAGNSATASVTVNLETTPPTISATATPAANAAGWNKSPVTVNFTCTQSVAPITSCPVSQTVNGEGKNQQISGTVQDAAGNSATASVTLNIDLTPPLLSITSPANGANVTSPSVAVSGTVSDALSGVAGLTCNGAPATMTNGSFNCTVTVNSGSNTIAVQGTDVAGNTTSQSVTVIYAAGPAISSFSPASGAAGTLVTVNGTNLAVNGASPQVTLNQQGGGTIVAPVSSASANSLAFVIPSGAATGPITVTENGLSASSSTSLTIVSSSSFAITAGPLSLTLLPGQSSTVEVSLTSANGFTQLAALSVAGVPSGVTANFQPQQITAGQFSILTLTASGAQTGPSQLTISASATVQGIPLTQTAAVTVNVPASSGTAFAGRVAVTDAYDTPLVGVGVRFTGKNYTGASTGCTSSTTTDAAGNFELSGLPSACSGAQLIQYDPSTVSSPQGHYSGVTLSYVLASGQVTTPGIIVHLPRVDNAETVQVQQNASVDQTFAFKSIPGVSITVYAGTTFSLADGTQPSPFPLSVMEIPYDRLPEKVTPDPTQDPVFAMSIEPFNSSSSQPIAVIYPNRSHTSPGTTMPVTSLNPVLGAMVNYGTATVSANGTQVIPDPDPAFPGHRYGISHFDWHLTSPPPRNKTNPCPNGSVCPPGGDPVDAASGILTLMKTDIVFGGARGQVAITRTQRGMSTIVGPFGIGTNHNYSYVLAITAAEIDLLMPDGNSIPFALQPDGTFQNTTNPAFIGTVVSSPSAGIYALRWKDGRVYQFQYVPSRVAAYLTSMTDANGNKTTLVGLGGSPQLISQVIDPAGRALNITYGSGGLISGITDPIGRSVQYTYNPQVMLATVTDPAGGVTSYGYDSQNNLTSITDPRGITFLQNTYDSNGRVIKQVAADGGVTTFSYALLNPAISTSSVDTTSVTDPLGNTTVYHFNPQAALLDVTDALGQKTVYNVDSTTNQTLSVTDPLGRTTAFTYDSVGNVTSFTRLALPPGSSVLGGGQGPVTTTFTYDPVFNKISSVTDSSGNKTQLQYDAAAGNLLSVLDPLNHSTTFGYDNFGEVVLATDPLHNSSHFAYANGDLVGVTDPLGRTTTRTTDGIGRMTVFTNSSGRTTQYQYNTLDQITQITDAAGNQTSYDFDLNGNLISFSDPNQHVTRFVYDLVDRLVGRTDPLGRSESFQYDQNGNPIQFTDRRGKIASYTYDPLNRRIKSTFGPGESSTLYSYDAANRLVQIVDSITGTISRAFDGLDHLTSETTRTGGISYTYDAIGRRASMNTSGQMPVNYSYDNADRLLQIVQGSSVVNAAYDDAGRRTLLTSPNGIATSYTYDSASQLTTINYQLGATSLGNLTYTYDLDGRRTSLGGSLARTGLPQAMSLGTYNSANELTQWGNQTLSYDLNGNLISDGSNTYLWNARNQLVSITGAASTSFQYDPFGKRVKKAFGTSSIDYLYDGLSPVQEFTGGVSTAANMTGLALNEYFQRNDQSGSAGILTDALGSTLALTGPSGNVLAQYTYEPFGNASVTGSRTTPYQFTGQENDGTGLYFYRARYYNPTFSRFISEDPVGLAGGINPYAYAHNDPLNLVDPLGLFTPDVHYQLAHDAAIAAGYSQAEADRIADEDVMTDFAPNSQDTDAMDANTHAMAGRKPNGRYQTCSEALAGTAARIGDSIAAGSLGPALHTVQDAQAEGHKFQEWHGGMPSLSHIAHDAVPSSSTYETAFNNSVKLLKDVRNNTVANDLTSYLTGNGPVCGGGGSAF